MSRRVPIRMQSGLAECGAACLAMVLSWHGRRTTVREVSDRAAVGRDGLSALALVHTAREFGLESKAFSVEPEQLRKVPLPAIVHWEFNHFVVVESFGPRGVRVVDPARGRRHLSHAEFDVGFTGVVLAFAPDDGFQPGRGAGRPWLTAFLREALAGQRALIMQILLVSLLLQLAGLGVQGFAQVLVDTVLPVRADRLLAVLGAALGIVALIHLVLGYLRSLAMLNLRVRIDGLLTARVVDHLFALPYRFFVFRGASDLVQRSTSVSLLRQMLTGQVTTALLDGPLALGYVLIVTVQAPLLGACLIGFALLQAGLLLATRRRMMELSQRELSAQIEAQGSLIEAIGGMETLKVSGTERAAARRWVRLFTAQLNADSRVSMTENVVTTMLDSVRFLAPAALLWAGSWQVLYGGAGLGSTLALTGLAVAALGPIGTLLSSLQTLQEAVVHVDRLADIMESEREPHGEIEVTHLGGQVELDRVSFRYDPRAPWTLRDISLKIGVGQKIALVGRSGSGKSTLARILLGLYEPTEGTVSYDGFPMPELERASLRRHFGVVTQDPDLFTGSVRENICLGRPDAGLEEITEAARLACVHEDIAAMPMGYDTMLSEGTGLSGGQRQRLALARALLAKPRVLLLDEATSHLDTVTEAEIESNLSWLTQTRIVIAHRLSTVRDADLIVVIDKGRIVERGTHRQLVALGGHYAALVNGQAPALQ
ncbi:peptidase domain-containing ABC transporter [Nonomuraea sp. NPDC050328]|uniref:peptidase domain-containing ABC transporter n=1 Tax=Nonomuraea sp. NPDC050328 TaxID=3364361 RepID=UPI0037B2B3E7